MRNSTQPKCQQQLTDVLAFKTDTSWETECWVLFLKSSQRPGFFKHIFGLIRIRSEYNSMTSSIRWSFLWNSLLKVWYTTVNISLSPHLNYTTLHCKFVVWVMSKLFLMGAIRELARNCKNITSTRGKSLLESWVTTFVSDWQLPLILDWFMSNF